MSGSIEKTIDIEKILKNKMGSKAKFVPGFLVSWLKKIIHEDEVNKFLWESRNLSGTEWLTECVRYLKMDVEIVGLENLPDKNDGKLYTFVSNHPLGGQDGVCLGSIIGTHYDGKFRYLVNDLLLNLPGLKPVSIGINIRDLPWKKTFISKSVEYQRDVVPIHFGGQNSERFYRIARFSDKHLPFNLAMMFLVDEMYKNVGKHFRIAIGKPIPWQTFDHSKSATEWAQYVKDRVYEL